MVPEALGIAEYVAVIWILESVFVLALHGSDDFVEVVVGIVQIAAAHLSV